ncbi:MULTISPECIES: hypothetical protein [unclassified Chryseobacterium]|uniref:hypothetical protein n=1 Tax=unclassified Chryseobacterium TaxID=2593645 RepID=UPI000E72F319|nr:MULTISPECIES: hypothetical protein [unclassified Chryseobacterium]RKE83047.1 hypothetical protein DEU39_2615 [Chryseobacterium sp. AG363]WNI38899.1 hypothetical protein RHP76_10465 [Chryseobacterium sp. SG20098]
MKAKIFRYRYSVIFLVYCITVYFLSKNASLVFEWKVIMEDFSIYDEYYYLGKPTAYMPPLYPYYLLLIESIVKTPQWIMISCILQSVILFFSVLVLVLSFEKNAIKKNRYFFAFGCIIFFPPILLGATKISSFALTLSVFCIFFALVLKLSQTVTAKSIILILIFSIAGLYLRFEFLFLMIISAIMLIGYKRMKYYNLLFVFAFIFIAYLPWCIRNYEKTGVFHYSTSLNYNFAKGNNEKYDIFSSENLPYDPKKKLLLTDEYLRQNFTDEKQIDQYLKQLNKNFISEHPELFIKNSFKKIGINFLNYYPGNYNFTSAYIMYLYSGILLVFSLLFIYTIIKKLKLRFSFDAVYTGIIFIFYLLFYSIAPLPRYFLLYFPLFFLFVFQNFDGKLHSYLLKIKKTNR